VPEEDRPFFQPRVLVPFLILTLIGGSTWIVIKDQLGTVPPGWSVAYRYIIASAAMFAYGAAKGLTLRMSREGHLLAAGFGLPQFFLTFNFVYLAELYVTSGLVAIVFALLLVPNSLLAWLFLQQKSSRRFLARSGVAVIGVGLLFLNEMRSSTTEPSAVLIGLALTLAGVLSASVSHVMQATEKLRAQPIVTMLAWGMLYGMVANTFFALFLHGPPVMEHRVGYWLGLIYLALFASALGFVLYLKILREVGPGRAAYSSLVVPILAMFFSTLFEDYRWTMLAAGGCVSALLGLFIALKSAKPAPGE
jgi:drug/metabolite transporter (DMT)-like permease